MSRVLKQYISDNNAKCPYNAQILVNYARKAVHLRNIEWIDAHVAIEQYMLYDRIVDLESNTEDDDQDEEVSQTEISSLSIPKFIKQHSNNMESNNKNKSLHSMSQRNDEIFSDPKKYKKRVVTDVCIAFIDVIVLICCTILIAIAGSFILMMGINKHLFLTEYSIKGECICIQRRKTCDINTNCNSVTYDHTWKIYNNTICNNQLYDNYTFQSLDDDINYNIGAIETCFTNNNCDNIYIGLDKEFDDNWRIILFYCGGIVLLISLCCFVICIGSYCVLCETKRLIHCSYCKDCFTYYKEKDNAHYNEKDVFECIINYYCRILKVELNHQQKRLLYQYYTD